VKRSGAIGPRTLSASRTASANTHRNPLAANADACGWMLPTFSTIVVVPVRIASSAATLTMSSRSPPSSRLAGETGRRVVFGNPKSSLKPRAMTALMWA
jgi:hypothetical protein